MDPASEIRLNPELEKFGVLGDIGWYCIGFASFLMKYDTPAKVQYNKCVLY
jgi:hypothetical protein